MTSTPSTPSTASGDTAAVDQWLDHQTWRRHLAEHLGLNVHQVADIRHHDRTPGWRAIGWTSTVQQRPHPLPDAFIAIDRPTLQGDPPVVFYDQELYVRPHQWQNILDTIGPEPEPIGPDARRVLDQLRHRGMLPKTEL